MSKEETYKCNWCGKKLYTSDVFTFEVAYGKNYLVYEFCAECSKKMRKLYLESKIKP